MSDDANDIHKDPVKAAEARGRQQALSEVEAASHEGCKCHRSSCPRRQAVHTTVAHVRAGFQKAGLV